MKQMSRLITVGGFLLTVFGCASFTSPARERELENNKAHWFDYDATRRGAILMPAPSNSQAIRFCAEPSPDVALQITDKFKAKGGDGTITAEAEMDFDQDVIQLAQRTQTIMFLRESLYRLCELSMNMNITPTEIVGLYTKVLDSSTKLAEAELSYAKQKEAIANTRLEQIKKLSLAKYKDEEEKIEKIISAVKNDEGKIDKDKLSKILPGTGLDQASWINNYAGKDCDILKRALVGKERTSAEALYKNINLIGVTP
jgi:hypothetical protein